VNPDDAVRLPTVTSKNRDRLIDVHVVEAFSPEAAKAVCQCGQLSHEDFTVNGLSRKAFERKLGWERMNSVPHGHLAERSVK
jgi:hypothetical protein